MTLILSSAVLAKLQRHASASDPLEACGLLFGDEQAIFQALPTKNVAEEPERHFEVDPAALIAAERAMRAGGDRIIGYYHSHPTGSVNPSRTDAAMAAPDNRIWLIVNGKDAAAWRAVENGQLYGRFDPMTLDCRDTNRQTADD